VLLLLLLLSGQCFQTMSDRLLLHQQHRHLGSSSNSSI
jgi:hypothetical protein